MEASGIVGVCSDFPVHFDETLGEDGSDLPLVQSILETIPNGQKWDAFHIVPEEENQGK